MKQKTRLIYKHTCKINGKGYVGMTCQNIYKRWQNSYGYNIKEQLFGKAIHKYG